VITSKSGPEVDFSVDLGKTGPTHYPSAILAHGYGLKDLQLACRLGGRTDHSDIEVLCGGAKEYSHPAYSCSNGPVRDGFYPVDLPSGFPNSSWGPYVQCGVEMIVYGVFSSSPLGTATTSVVSAQVLAPIDPSFSSRVSTR
jgi:hypothetical protein